ncbi:MAG: hypothetical protein IIA87_04440 [Nanoarchaeota archaeon]|nr:hypothetical protein [Nanoarchaeota archaeon]
MKRSSQEIKKEILEILSKGKSYSYAQLERKVNTGYRSIVLNCKELESFNAVEIKKRSKHSANGRPYFVINITEQGRKFLQNLRNQ